MPVRQNPSTAAIKHATVVANDDAFIRCFVGIALERVWVIDQLKPRQQVECVHVDANLGGKLAL